MPYNPNDPLYQTGMSRVMNFHDFEQEKHHEVEDLKKMKRNFKKRGEMHSAPGERKHKWNMTTHKIDDLSHEEVEDKVDALQELEENHHAIQNYMFFANLKTLCRLSRKMLNMDRHELDQMLSEHNWALDHIATSKDDVEEVFNWVMSYKYDHNDKIQDENESEEL